MGWTEVGEIIWVEVGCLYIGHEEGMVRDSETAKAKKKQMEQKKEKGKERAGERSHHKDAGKQEFKKEKEELGEGSPGTFHAPLVYEVKRQSL